MKTYQYKQPNLKIYYDGKLDLKHYLKVKAFSFIRALAAAAVLVVTGLIESTAP